MTDSWTDHDDNDTLGIIQPSVVSVPLLFDFGGYALSQDLSRLDRNQSLPLLEDEANEDGRCGILLASDLVRLRPECSTLSLSLNDLQTLHSHLLITRPSQSSALETFVVERAEESTHSAMLVRHVIAEIRSSLATSHFPLLTPSTDALVHASSSTRPFHSEEQ